MLAGYYRFWVFISFGDFYVEPQKKKKNQTFFLCFVYPYIHLERALRQSVDMLSILSLFPL